MPGVTKSIIKISAYNNSVEIQTTENAERKYHEVIDLPEEADIETAKSVYNNGILEITFKKKDQTKPKGKTDKDRIEKYESPFSLMRQDLELN